MRETRQELGDERLERRRDRDDERRGGGRLGGVRFLLSLVILVLVAVLDGLDQFLIQRLEPGSIFLQLRNLLGLD